jgi:pyridoxamine 5'-phosphate oxidase
MTTNVDIDPPADPWILFREWYALAEKHEPDDPGAMALATADAGGAPSVRMVLMKEYGEGGIIFFTNRESRKGEELARNPKAALCLHWKSLDRQVRAEGPVSLLQDDACDRYFATRPRESQIGAWASRQSRPLASHAAFLDRGAELEKRYEGEPVPRPPYWGGYRLMPLRIEFWQERPFRLHDRIVYDRAGPDNPWATARLYP